MEVFELNDAGKIQVVRAYWNPGPVLAALQAAEPAP
jgi:hypothetical protein